MKKQIFIWITFLNVVMVIIVIVVGFLILPLSLQHIFSTGIYLVAAIAGIAIGSLVSKIYLLRQKLRNQQEALKKKEENIQEYLTNVVHDLRSPVASINMISQLLEEEITDINPIHTELIHSVNKSSKMMLDRICCILDNAQLEYKNTFEELVYENPYPILKSIVDKHHVLAIDKDIDIQLNVSPYCQAVCFNKEAFDSIFSNLLSNAIKYSMPKTIVQIFCKAEKKSLVFSVKDQGLGMTDEDLSKVFGRFAKLSARPTGNEDSSGVGLSLVKLMAERMNGKVAAFSEGKGKGSTFNVTLPTTIKAKVMTA